MRIGVGIIVLNNQNRVFVGKRRDNPGDNWQMPQGGVDKGESYINAMKRELLEETGIMINTHKHKKIGTFIIKDKLFYILQLLKDINIKKPIDTTEIGDIKWLPIANIVNFIKQYQCNITIKELNNYLLTIYESRHKTSNE